MHVRHRPFSTGFALLLTLNSLSAMSDDSIAVIVNKQTAGFVNPDQIGNIFLGKASALPNGTHVIPVDQDNSSPLRAVFYQKTTGKDLNQLRAYWARVIFAGKGEPPKEVGGDSEVVKLVSTNPNLIGYVHASSVNSSVITLLSIK